VYITGGRPSTTTSANTLYRYSPASNSFTQLASHWAQYGHATVLVDDSLFSLGGFINASATPTTTILRYNITSGSWGTAGSMTAARSNFAAVAVNSLIYIVGGADSTGTEVNTFQRFDPVLNTWTSLTALPAGARNGPAAVAVGTQIYVSGGRDNSFRTTFSRYDTTSAQWATLPTFPTGRAFHAMAASGDFIFIFGGLRAGSNLEASLVRYSISANTWTAASTLTAMPTAYSEFRACILDGLIYAWGGLATNPVATGRRYNITAGTWSEAPATIAALPSALYAYGLAVQP
jgi:N-acetylneuraminic acid mutarotase